MSAQMTSPSFLFLTALFVALLILASAQDDYPTKPTITGKGFVIVCCAQTPHPDVCYSTLAKRYNATQDDYGCISRMAMRLNLNESQRFADSLKALSSRASGPAKAAIDGCVKDIAVATSKVSATIEKLVQVRGWTGQPLQDAVAVIDSWIASATTSEQACANLLKGVSNVGEEIVQGIESLSAGTANAMGLVYYYDSNVGSSPTEGFDYAEPGALGPSP